MYTVNRLIDLWKSNVHVPKVKELKQLVPRRLDDVESKLVDFLGDPDYLNAVKLTLSTLLDAWTELCSADPDDLADATLEPEDLLLVAQVVPLYLPKKLPQDLQLLQKQAKKKSKEDTTHGRKRKAEGFTTGKEPKKPLTFQDILAMDDSNIPEKFKGFAEKRQKGRKLSSPSIVRSDDEAAHESDNEPNIQAEGVDEDPGTTQRPVWRSTKTRRLARQLGVHGTKELDKEPGDGAQKRPTSSKKFRATNSEEHDPDRTKDWREFFAKQP